MNTVIGTPLIVTPLIVRPVIGALVAIVAMVTTTAACATRGPKKRETASLAAAVERFLRAENSERPAAAPAVASVVCTEPEVRAVRDLCVQATDATSRALLLKAEVERGLDDLQRGRITRNQASGRNLDEKLALAARLLDEGKAKMALCDEQLTALKRDVGM